MIWSATYTGPAGAPATPPPSLSPTRACSCSGTRWRGSRGTLYAQGMTSYTPGNPLDAVAASGESVLVYPGADGPVASARLEQIRDGIEDWDVLDAVRRKRGAAAVRTILANAGLFSATAGGSSSPAPSAASSTASTLLVAAVVARRVDRQKIEAAHLQALRAASG